METHNRPKAHSARNRTLVISDAERQKYGKLLLTLKNSCRVEDVVGRIICQDIARVAEWLPHSCADLMIFDPPYNLNKKFNSGAFSQMPLADYEAQLESWLAPLMPILKDDASVYICGDWRSSAAIHRVASRYLRIRNRITWEREKGRGAKANWKNCAEDIWFCTVSNTYNFHVERVKMKRKVIAPYRDGNGAARDWRESSEGKFRVTYPSNLWSDISVPFWSMPENTAHPTQKPEKLISKLILASSDKGSVVFDPFLGSGTTAAVAKKLGRRFFGVEIDADYCCMSLKRLDLADKIPSIQGYADGVFWERNTLAAQLHSLAAKRGKGLLPPSAFSPGTAK